MNRPQAISRNRAALVAVVATIVALIGGREGGLIARSLRNAALALLRPAEAAARRLIMACARGVAAPPRPARVIPEALGARRDDAPAGAARPPAFRLFDALPRFGRLRRIAPKFVPRIRTFWGPPLPPPPVTVPFDPDAPVESRPISLRIAALERALADLPRQARRFVRWRARPDMRPRWPLRPGRPPGWRASEDRAVDIVLRDCHELALGALASDTS
jgi:hypothetical protein